MSADGSPGPSGAWKPPAAFKFGAGFQPKPPAIVAQPTRDASEDATKRVIPAQPKFTNPAPFVSPPKESNGATTRAWLQAKSSSATTFAFSPPKAVDKTSEPSQETTTVADKAPQPTSAPAPVEPLREDIEFPVELLELVEEIKLDAAGKPGSVNTTKYPGVIEACNILSPFRPNNSVLLLSAGVRIREFLDAFSKLSTSEMFWFMSDCGYLVLLHLCHDPSFDAPHNAAALTRYRTTLASLQHVPYSKMLSSFESLFIGSSPARALIEQDFEHLALHGNLPLTTMSDIAKDYPVLRRVCAAILIKKHTACSGDPTGRSTGYNAVEIVVALARLCAWIIACNDDELSAHDTPLCVTASSLLTTHLRAARCPADEVGDVADFVLALLRAAVRHFADKSWVVELLEVVLGQADALSERVGRAIVREELLLRYATNLPIGMRDRLVLSMVELLLIPHLPDGSGRRLPRITKQTVEQVVSFLFTPSRTGSTLSFAYPLTMLHLSCNLMQGSARRKEGGWAVVPCVPTPTGFLTAVRSALVKCMERQTLPPASYIPMRDTERNALLPAADANDATECALLVSCGWDPYLESIVSRVEYGTPNNKYSAFIKAIRARGWDTVRIFLQSPPAPINRLFTTDVISNRQFELMPALTRLAYAGQADLMRILLERQPSVAAHRHKEEAMSPMHAAVHGSAECVSLLLAHGVDAKEPEIHKAPHQSHLMCALKGVYMTTVRLLLEQKVPIDGTCRYMYPAYKCDWDNKTRVEILRLLLANGGDPMEPSNFNSPTNIMQQAMIDTNAQVAQLLLDHGAHYEPIVNAARPFWVHTRSRHSNPSEILRVIIGHNLPNDFRATWELGELDFLYDTYGDVTHETLVRVMEVLLEFGYFTGSELLVGAEGKVSLARNLDTTSEEYRPLAQLLVDFGCPPGARENVEEEGYVDLVEYVPTKRLPTCGYRYKVNGWGYHYIPWRPALHPYTPRTFRDAARAIAHLRLQGITLTVTMDEPASPSSAMALWASLPLEIFEAVINELYQHVRAAVAATYAPLQPAANEEHDEDGEGEEEYEDDDGEGDADEGEAEEEDEGGEDEAAAMNHMLDELAARRRAYPGYPRAM